MNAPKNISLRIPAKSDWRESDLETKAANHGMNKSEFMVMAIDTFMGFDDGFINTMKKYADGLHTSMYIVMQNMIIQQIARDKAKRKVWPKGRDSALGNFKIVDRGEGPYVMTGQELMDHLVDQYTFEEQRKKDEFDNKLKR